MGKASRRKLSDSAPEMPVAWKHARSSSQSGLPGPGQALHLQITSADFPGSSIPGGDFDGQADSLPALEDSESDRMGLEFEVDSPYSSSYSSDDDIWEDEDPEKNEDETGRQQVTERFYFQSSIYSGSWQCVECAIVNLLSHRCCLYCWALRPNWPPSACGVTSPGPVLRTNYRTRDVENKHLTKAPRGLSDTGATGPHMHISGPSLPAAIQCSIAEHHQNECSNSPTVASCSQENIAHGAVPDTCIICQQRARDTTIVHGQTGHLVSCQRCARKMQDHGKPCPICRAPIDLVVRTYV
uniref:E3 ubiquitin-protein ligase Mdm2-like n=1 Tax=Myxine glutinosa TaxID=7769 RepID=UPI00358F3C63